MQYFTKNPGPIWDYIDTPQNTVNWFRYVSGKLPKTEYHIEQYLENALKKDNVEAVDLLLSSSSNPHDEIKKYHLIWNAIVEGAIKIFKLLVQKYNIRTEYTQLLSTAIETGSNNKELYSLLKDSGSDLNEEIHAVIYYKPGIFSTTKSELFRGTPIEIAQKLGNTELVKILKELGAGRDDNSINILDHRSIPAPGHNSENGEYVNEISYDPIQKNDIMVNFVMNPGSPSPQYAYNLGKYYKKNSINAFHKSQGSKRHPVIQGKQIGKMTYYKAKLPTATPVANAIAANAPANATAINTTVANATVANATAANATAANALKRRTRGRWCPGGKCPLFGKNQTYEGGYKRKRRSTRRRSHRSRKNLK